MYNLVLKEKKGLIVALLRRKVQLEKKQDIRLKYPQVVFHHLLSHVWGRKSGENRKKEKEKEIGKRKRKKKKEGASAGYTVFPEVKRKVTQSKMSRGMGMTMCWRRKVTAARGEAVTGKHMAEIRAIAPATHGQRKQTGRDARRVVVR